MHPITKDLRGLLKALLNGNCDRAWSSSRLLTQAVENNPGSLPPKSEVAALLAELLSQELMRAVDLPPIREH